MTNAELSTPLKYCMDCPFGQWKVTEKTLTEDGLLVNVDSCPNVKICARIHELSKKEEKTADWIPVTRTYPTGGTYQLDDEWYGDLFQCSICGEPKIGNDAKFCPGCGAKMTVEKYEQEG